MNMQNLQGTWLRESQRLQDWLGTYNTSGEGEALWSTRNRRHAITESVALRCFGETAESAPAGHPVLVVTPQVNHSYIADFSADQSLVRTLLGAGSARVGVTDWLPPPRGQRYTIADSLEDIFACLDHLGEPAHLIGLCQGGWQVAMVAALRPERVASLTVAAAPIDAHLGGTLLHAYSLGLPFAFYRALVAMSGGVAPGPALSAGFDLLRPWERLVYKHLSLFLNAHDEEYLERYRDLQRWYRLHKDIAGELYLEVVHELFQKNALARGKLMIRDERVDLGEIQTRVFLVAGTRDHITPPEQVFALEALAPRATCSKHLVDAGHIGVFMGRRALATVWDEIGAEIGAAGQQ